MNPFDQFDDDPRGIRNNNPLNITGRGWDGQTGSDGAFAQFATPEDGRTAADANLQAYQRKHGIDTIAGVVARWAPPHENDTAAYISRVSSKLGIDPNARLDLADPAVRGRLLDAMQEHETGQPVMAAAANPFDQFDQASTAAGEAPVAEGRGAQVPPAARRNPVVITNADTGEPYSDAIQGVYGDLIKRGEIDPNAAIGSRAFPRAMVAGGQAAPGEWYVDETGLHAAPGVREPGFGELVAEPWEKLGSDLQGSLARRNSPGVGGFLRDLGADVVEPFQLGGDVLAALSSPLTAALEKGVVQPGARLLDKIPLDAYAAPELHFDGLRPAMTPARRLTDQEAHDANADSLRLGLSAIPAQSGASIGDLVQALKGGGLRAAGDVLATAPRGMDNLEALATAADDAAAARGVRILNGEADATEAARARRYVQRKVDSAGSSPEALELAQDAAGGKPVMAAEAIGKNGQTALGAIARREGGTADALAAELQSRREGRAGRMVDDFAKPIGLNPDASLNKVDALVQRGRDLAEPLYEEAYAAGPAFNDQVGKILQTPAGKEALKQASRLMRNEFKDPEALGMAFLEDPQAWASYEPPAFDVTAAPERGPVGFAGGRGPAKAPSRGQSLGDYVADRGGISDLEGDAAALGLDMWHAGRPFRRRLITDPSQAPLPGQDGQPAWYVHPEAVAQRAWEAGYFPELADAPTPEQLLHALSEEMRGRFRYAREADAGAQGRFDARAAADELAYRGGDPADLPDPDQYVGRPEPTTAPTYEHVPNAQTLDYVKRAFDDMLKPWTSGKQEWDHEGLGILNLKNDLVRQLTGDEAAGIRPLSPKYREALEVSGDYLTHKQAFDDGHRFILDSRVNDAEFSAYLEKLNGPQLNTFLEGISRRLLEEADKGFLTPRRLQNNLVRKKLRAILGEAGTNQFLERVAREAGMQKFERRVDPDVNSSTAEMGREMTDQDAAGRGAQVAGAMLEHGSKGLVGGLASLVRAGARGAADRIRTAGMPVGVRDEAGRMLMMSPAELAALLREGAPQMTYAGGPSRYAGMFGRTVMALPLTDRPRPRETQRLAGAR